MAKGINKVTLLGNLGKDPEFFDTKNGNNLCKFSLATTESYKDKSGEWQETTSWHNVVLWNNLAKMAEKYLRKGSRIYLEGKLNYGSYEKDGITRYTTDIQGSNVIMLDAKNSQEPKPSQEKPKPQRLTADDDDEIPF